MYFFIYGVIAGALTFAGLSYARAEYRITFSIVLGVIFGFVGWLAMPTFAWNYPGNWILLMVLAILIGYFGSRNGGLEGKKRWLAGLVLFPILLMIVTTWGGFHASSYRELLGEPIASDFTADISPVNINQIRQVDGDLAQNVGSKRIEGRAGLGSRVDLGAMNIQLVNGCFETLDVDSDERRLCYENELVWVGPLNHGSFFKWLSNGTTPGYVIVSATDSTDIHLVTALRGVEEKSAEGVSRMGPNSGTRSGFDAIELRYLTDNAYFSDYVLRHVRTSGYSNVGLTDFSFEIDDNGRPYWVITKYEPTIGFSGEDATGVVVVDAQTGSIAHYSVEDAPAWIDRIQPEDIVKTQLDDWGKFVDGWWNTWFGREDIVRTTEGMSLVYGADGQSYWYSGMQSSGGSDDGTNSIVLVNTRTKEVRRYMVDGASETAARASAENAPGVRERQFTGTDPVLYNIAGEPTYFLTLKGEDGLVKMYAFVGVHHFETVGVGDSVGAALRAYQNNLLQQGNAVRIDDLTTQQRIEGTVSATAQIGETFYLQLSEQPDVEFYGTSDVSPELKWARVGQTVVLVTERGETKSVQLYAFDIPSLGVSGL